MKITFENISKIEFTADADGHGSLKMSCPIEETNGSEIELSFKSCDFVVANNEIIIKVSPVKHIFKNMYLDNNCLCLNSETLVGSLVMYYPADSINSASVVPFDYDTEKKRYFSSLLTIIII